MNRFLLLPLTTCLLLVVTSGCFQAENKFYRESDIVTDGRMEGQFHSSDAERNNPIVIKPAEDRHYAATYSDGGKWMKLDVVLFKCGGNLFLDVSHIADNGLNHEPAVGPSGLDMLHIATLYNTHSVMRVRFTEKGFELGGSHGNPVYNVLKKYPYLKFRVGTETQPLDPHQKILTNPTEELHRFLEMAGTNDAVFEFHGGLERVVK